MSPNHEPLDVAVLCWLCSPGDRHMWRAVMRHFGLTEAWNDADGRTVDDVIKKFTEVRGVTEADMEAVFGPQWRPVRGLVRRAAIMTEAEVHDLAYAGGAAWGPATYPAWSRAAYPAWSRATYPAWSRATYPAWSRARDAALGAVVGYGVRDAAMDAAGYAARDAARVAVVGGAWGPVGYAARDVAEYAALALVARDALAPKYYATLTQPWRQTIGPVHPDDPPIKETPS